MKRTSSRGVKQTLKPCAYKRSEQRLSAGTRGAEAKASPNRAREESAGADAKPSDLPLARMKDG